MGIFDIDSGTDNHLLNEQFHVFSKSPASVATALGDASNRSGHTVTASDVWGQEIPAFFYAKTQSVADSYKSLAKTNDLCRIGNSVAIFENGNWVVKYNSYTDIPDGHKFKNANGDEVIRFHKNRLAYNLNLDNNAADDGLDTTAKIQGWDEENGKVYDYVATAPKFVTQFVTSTDKIVDGIPSKGFGPFVMAGTTTGDITKVLPEGTSDQNHYIANSFAGIIQFNRARTDAIYVHAFEYCGKTLKSAYSDIVELDEKLSKISVTAAGGVQAVSDTAKAAGLEIDSVVVGGVTTPTLDLTTGSATAGETRLVTGGTVASAIDTAVKITGIQVKVGDAEASAVTPVDKIVTIEIPEVQAAVVTSGAITTDGFAKASDAKAIAEKAITDALAATGEDTLGGKIAAAQQAAEDAQGTADEALAEAQAKVASVTTGTVPDGVSFTTGTTPQLSIVTSSNTCGDANYLVTKSRVEAIANEYADIAANATISTINGRSLANTTTSTQGSYVSVTTSGTVGTGLTVNVNDSALASTVSAAASAIQGITLNGDTVNSNRWVAVGENNIANITLPKVTFNPNFGDSSSHGFSFSDNLDIEGRGISNHYIGIAAAVYTPLNREDAGAGSWSEETAGKWADATSDYFTTASSVKIAISDAVTPVAADLATLENKVNAYHEAGVSYKVHTGTELPDLTVAENVELYKNVILLVPTLQHPDGSPDLDDAEAMSGGYIEYLCVKTGETTYAWEKIGTTEADLEGYVCAISGYNQQGAFTKASPVYAKISSAGYLTLGIDTAASDTVGVSKLFTGHYEQMANVYDKYNTAVSLETISTMFARQDAAYANNDNVVNSVNGLKGQLTLCVHNYTAGNATPEGNNEMDYASNHANLWGMSVLSHSGLNRITLADEFVGMSNSYLTTANLPSDAVSVENNFVMDADGYVITTIRPERMVSGFYAQYASGLTSFVGDLSNLETAKLNGGGSSTFYNCSALETFIGDLSSLKSGIVMFGGCYNLTTFIGDLSSLEKGGNIVKPGSVSSYYGGMFVNTNLTVESVENIADTLPENPVVNVGTSEGTIGISWKELTTVTEERQELVDALCGVLDKGWVLVTNSELLTMFDTEKYQVVQQTIQPLDLESEPQEIAYVVKK